VTVTTPIQASAIAHLASIRPCEVPLKELAEIAWRETSENQRAGREECRSELSSLILECYSSGLVDLFACTSDAVSDVSENPEANVLARYRAAHGGCITNSRHETVTLSQFDRMLLERLDGSLTLAMLTDEVLRLFAQKELSLHGDSDPKDAEICAAIQHSLNQMARAGLLIA
jgi:hypothetical protein